MATTIKKVNGYIVKGIDDLGLGRYYRFVVECPLCDRHHVYGLGRTIVHMNPLCTATCGKGEYVLMIIDSMKNKRSRL